ncbi:hypothetical protein Tco_1199186 [Tanacetum coccineum]
MKLPLSQVRISREYRVLRRSARLSLNSASYDVVDNVGEKSSRKRKPVAAAVKLENKEQSGEEEVDGSGLNGTDGVVMILMDDGTIAAADARILAIGRASTSSSRMKERFKNECNEVRIFLSSTGRRRGP